MFNFHIKSIKKVNGYRIAITFDNIKGTWFMQSGGMFCNWQDCWWWVI